MDKQDNALLEQTIRYDFGAIPKVEAHNMWRCDIRTGELKKVHLKKETKMVPTGKKDKFGRPKKILQNFYYIDSKLHYFYMFGRTGEEAQKKFEANFAKLGEKIEATKAQQTKAEGAQDPEEDKK